MEQTQQKPQFPSEEVTLPSKGLLYPEGSPLKSGIIEMKYMTAKEEDILTNANFIQNGTVIDKLLQSLILSDINYNDLEANLILGNTSFNLNYLEENNHIGTKNYIKSGINVDFNNSGQLNFNIKKNLETDSTEFYDLAYDYINDCLRAGLVYRREFYNDSELEPENSLMFKITLTPFGNINSPSFSQ